MKYFFQAVSYILHPLFMPMLGLYILFESPTLPNSLLTLDALYFFPDQAKNILYIVLGILTFLAPGLSLLIMYWNRMISTLDLEDRQERFYPFILIIFYFVLTFVYLKLRLPDFLQHPALMSYIFGIIMVFVLAFFINFKVKMSMHTAGIFGLCGAILAYNETQIESNLSFLFYLICLGGLVGSARVYLKKHTLQEVLVGMFVGFSVLFVCVRFSLYI